MPTTPVQAPPGATAVNLDGQFVVIDPKSDVLALRVGPQTKNLLLVEAAHATVQGAATSLVGLTAGMTLDIVAYGVTVSGHRVFVAVTIIAHPAS